ncbi:MAG TPA: sigma-70 family RNA polymerase sigma factor [Bryobacteraceae bacterium]|nr:sigma-70 family RNA polymerase sigma factor [Bryobacteraceae bacterium]
MRAVELSAAEWDETQPVDAANRLVLELYDREHVSLRRYLLYLGVDPETAAETLQETFLRLHKHLLGGGNQSNLRAWLYRVAHNLARNAQTSFRASRTGDLSEANARQEIADTIATPEERFLAREEEVRFAEALAKLSAAQKSCLLLRSQGLKYREIAEALNLSISTVGENVQRGLERLKELL